MKKYLIILVLIFLIGYALRVLFLKDNSLTFGYDQARDAYMSLEIANGNPKVLGPPSSTPGLYHGVLYYYLLAPAYLLGKGSPIVAAYWIAFINALTIFIVFVLTKKFSKSLGASLVASVFFAFSFESTQYATWLSNPTIGVITLSIYYLGLWLWISEKKSNLLWPIIAGIGIGLSIQAEIFLAYHLVSALIWLLYTRNNITRSGIVAFALSLLVGVSTMIISEFKFGFNGIGGLASLASSGDSIIASKGFGDLVLLYLNQLGKVFAYNSYPGNIGYGSGLVILLLFFNLLSWKGGVSWKPFLATWLLGHIVVVSLGGTSTPFLLVGVGTAVSILLGINIYNWYIGGNKLVAIFVSLVILVGNILMIVRENPKGSSIFSIQKDMLLSKQISAIDYTYQKSGGEKFTINTVTSPLWINIVWTYLYDWYGKQTYGYTPGWTGRDQIGQIASLETYDEKTKTRFLIIEPLAGIPTMYSDLTIGEENLSSKVVEEKSFGELKVQRREAIKIK